MEFSRRDTKIIKGIAICLMLYHHLFAYPYRVADGNVFVSLLSRGGTTLSTYIGQFGRICVPMFVLLSGYGMYASSRADAGQGSGALCLKRISSLYKTVFMVFAFALPVGLILGTTRSEHLMRDIIYNGLGLSYSFNKEWWFIMPFVILIVVYPALESFLDRKRASFPVDMFILLLYNGFVLYVLPQIESTKVLSVLSQTVLWNHIRVAMGLVPAFALGCMLCKYGILDWVKKTLGGKWQWCVAAIIAAAGVFYLRLYNNMTYDFINAAVFISAICVFLSCKHGEWIGKIFEKLGEESAIIWLIHTYFCYYWFQNLIFKAKYSILIFLVLLAVSFASAKLIRLTFRGLGFIYKKLTLKQS